MAEHIVTEKDGSIVLNLTYLIKMAGFEQLKIDCTSCDILSFLEGTSPLEYKRPKTFFEGIIKMYLSDVLTIKIVYYNTIFTKSYPITLPEVQQMLAELDAILAKDPNLSLIKGSSD